MPRSMSTAAPAQRASSSQPRMVTHATGPNSELEVVVAEGLQALVRIGASKVVNAAFAEPGPVVRASATASSQSPPSSAVRICSCSAL